MKLTKSTKTLFSTAAICIGIALGGVATAYASHYDMAFDEPGMHQAMKHKMKRMAKFLSLNEEQKIQIKEIKIQAKEQHKVLRTSMKQFRVEKQKLVQAEQFDEQAFNALQDAYQPIFSQLALLRVKTKHAIFNVLTVEQQEKWLKRIENYKAKGKKRHG